MSVGVQFLRQLYAPAVARQERVNDQTGFQVRLAGRVYSWGRVGDDRPLEVSIELRLNPVLRHRPFGKVRS